MNSPSRSRDALDGPVARGVAILIFFACAGALAYIHRDDLFPPEKAVSKADMAFDLCFEERMGHIAEMLKNRLVSEAQAALFRTRAEAMCRDQVRKTSGPGPSPLPNVR